jgi:hypothetical protein
VNAEERVQMLKQIPPQSNFEKKQKIKTAIVLTLATVVSILFLVYAFMQKLEADKQRSMAVAAQQEAEKQRGEAEKMRLTVQYQLMQAEKQREAAAAALAACEQSKRK